MNPNNKPHRAQSDRPDSKLGDDQPSYRILILCTGNSARSIMAEAIFNHFGEGMFQAFSAGSHPVGRVNPFALAQIESHGLDANGYRSKSWNEFTGDRTQPMDLVLTVCDNAAAESCPDLPGTPRRIHWSLPDPAAAAQGEERSAFAQCFDAMHARVEKLTALLPGNSDVSHVADKISRLAP